MRELRPDQVELPAPPKLTPEEIRKRELAIKNHNKMQTRYALTKNPIVKSALAERLKQSWIALGGPMPEDDAGTL